MRRLLSILMLFVLLCGCSSMRTNPFKGHAVIDWVDFVNLNGNSYSGLGEGVLKNPGDVTEVVVGEVQFKVADVVTNPDYRTQDGDAAFLDKGTKLYRVKGFDDEQLIAAKDEQRIGGYRLYAKGDFIKTIRHPYKDVPKDKVERVELYAFDKVDPYKTLVNNDMKRFIQLLDSGKDTQNYTPQNKEGDPTYYWMVFYINEPIAYAFSLADDRVNVFFSPWNTRIVDREIRQLL